MNLDLTPHLSRMRETAESLMVDAVTIARWDGTSYTNDEATGSSVKDYDPPYYSGKARIQQRAAETSEDAGAGRTVATLDLELQVPVTVTGIEVDDLVTVTSATWDDDLVGREFRVSALHHKTHATSRRVAIEEVVA